MCDFRGSCVSIKEQKFVRIPSTCAAYVMGCQIWLLSTGFGFAYCTGTIPPNCAHSLRLLVMGNPALFSEPDHLAQLSNKSQLFWLPNTGYALGRGYLVIDKSLLRLTCQSGWRHSNAYPWCCVDLNSRELAFGCWPSFRLRTLSLSQCVFSSWKLILTFWSPAFSCTKRNSKELDVNVFLVSAICFKSVFC